MSDDRTISEQAIDAAARAAYEEQMEDGDTPWDGFGGSSYLDYWRDQARAALRAALPYLMTQAWDEGAVAGWQQSGEGWNAEYPDESTGKCSVDLDGNPYRVK